MKKDNVIETKSYDFSLRIIKLYKYLVAEHKEYVISKQILKSGTSIGANLAEANGAISDNDFSAKISIAYKECLETKYWLALLKDTNYIDENMFISLFNDSDEISKMLFSILKSTRIKKNTANC